METAWEHFGREIPSILLHQTHVTWFTFGAGFVPSWGKNSLWWKKAKLLMAQELPKKENLRQDQLEKRFHRKSNGQLTQSRRMRTFLRWGQTDAFCVAEIYPHCNTASMLVACLWYYHDFPVPCNSRANHWGKTNFIPTDFGLKSIALSWQLPPLLSPSCSLPPPKSQQTAWNYLRNSLP